MGSRRTPEERALVVIVWIGILRDEKRSDEASDEESVEEEEAEAGYEEDSQEFDDLGE